MVSKEHIRVFVDTNVDASVLFIEPGATTIGELKRTSIVNFLLMRHLDGCMHFHNFKTNFNIISVVCVERV